MYESYYGLTGKPFQLNPDPSFYFGSSQHRRAMAFLEYGVHRNEGFIVITGEIGAGKTTLVRSLIGKLDQSKVVAANLVSTQLGADDTLRMVASAFGIPAKHSKKADLLQAIEAFLLSVAKAGKRCLLLVDEAQNLSPRAVEELRMLSNFQIEQNALLQSFLIGQPEFREILQSPHMKQLRQRVIAACHVGPMSAEETCNYVEHRLLHVGWNRISPSFSDSAYQAIFEASGGVPRRINTLCDRLMLYGFLSGKKSLDDKDVEDVVEEMEEETSFSKPASEKGEISLMSDYSSSDTLLSDDMESRQIGSYAQNLTSTDQISLASLLERMVRIENRVIRIEGTLAARATNLGKAIEKLEKLENHLIPPEQVGYPLDREESSVSATGDVLRNEN